MNKYQINYIDLQTQEYKKHIIEGRKDDDAIGNFRRIFSIKEAQIVLVKKHADKKRKMKIELEPYDHTCADGCCYTTGYDVFIDGEKIGHTIGEDAMELAQLLNETFNTKEK